MKSCCCSAEVNLGLGNKAAAIADIDNVRIHAGGLAPTTLTTGSTDSAFVSEILYNRLMSPRHTAHRSGRGRGAPEHDRTGR